MGEQSERWILPMTYQNLVKEPCMTRLVRELAHRSH
jgi:hypothetical protein